MRSIVLFMLIILLASCASLTNYYWETVQSFRGGCVENLIKVWGQPDQIIQPACGNALYIYKTEVPRRPKPATPVTFSAVLPKPVIITTSHGTQAVTLSGMLVCLAIFEVNREGIIVKTQIQGRGCHGGLSFAEKMSYPCNQIFNNKRLAKPTE